MLQANRPLWPNFPQFFKISWGGVRLSPLGTSATNWPTVPAPNGTWWSMYSSRWNDNWQGKPKYWEKNYPSATFSTIDHTLPDLGSNLGRRGGKPATNRLSYGSTYFPRNYNPVLNHMNRRTLLHFPEDCISMLSCFLWTFSRTTLTDILFLILLISVQSRGISVSRATGYRLDGLGSISGRDKRFLSAPQCLGPTEPLPGPLPPVLKPPGHEADHSTLSNAKI
jgi:hypothetical protein